MEAAKPFVPTHVKVNKCEIRKLSNICRWMKETDRKVGDFSMLLRHSREQHDYVDTPKVYITIKANCMPIFVQTLDKCANPNFELSCRGIPGTWGKGAQCPHVMTKITVFEPVHHRPVFHKSQTRQVALETKCRCLRTFIVDKARLQARFRPFLD